MTKKQMRALPEGTVITSLIGGAQARVLRHFIENDRMRVEAVLGGTERFVSYYDHALYYVRGLAGTRTNIRLSPDVSDTIKSFL